jgi:hypothetical protein
MAELGLPLDLRQLAGLLVKNYVVKNFSMFPLDAQSSLKNVILKGLSDSHREIRNITTNLLGAVSRVLPVSLWGDVAVRLVQILEAPASLEQADGALVAMKRICEDSATKLASDAQHRGAFAAVPVLLRMLSFGEVKYRLAALEAIVALLFVIFDPPPLLDAQGNPIAASSNHTGSLVQFVPDVLKSLEMISADPDPGIRRVVCQALVLIMTCYSQYLVGSLSNICPFILSAIASSDVDVAMEASEFCIAAIDVAEGESGQLPRDHPIYTFLLQAIPLLMSRLALTPEQVEADRAEVAAEAAGQAEVKFHKSGNNHRMRRMNATSRGRSEGSGHEGGADDEEEEGGGGWGGSGASWTLRRQCASVLEHVTSHTIISAQDTLAIALPVVNSMLLGAPTPGSVQGYEWTEAEAGMLAVGILAFGCSVEMEVHLPVLVPYLCNQVVSNLAPEARATACWTLGRYADFAVHGLDSTAIDEATGRHVSSAEIFGGVMNVLARAVTDPNPKVQSAALTAMNSIFTSLSSLSEEDLETHISETTLYSLLCHIFEYSRQFGVRNALILCDVVATVCENLPNQAKSPKIIQLYLPFIMNQFLNVHVDDSTMHLFPIMETITATLGAAAPFLVPYAAQLLTRSLRIASSALQAYRDEEEARLYNQGSPANRPPGAELLSPRPQSFEGAGGFDLDFLVCALDVISALAGALVPEDQKRDGASSSAGTVFESLVREAGALNQLVDVLGNSLGLINDEDALQSAMGLAGEFTGSAPVIMLYDNYRVLGALLHAVYATLSRPGAGTSLFSNALWAAGEAISRYSMIPGANVGAFIEAVLPGMILILQAHSQATIATVLDPTRSFQDDENFLDELPHEYSLLQNLAVVLGRCALVSPVVMSQFVYRPIAAYYPADLGSNPYWQQYEDSWAVGSGDFAAATDREIMDRWCRYVAL